MNIKLVSCSSSSAAIATSQSLLLLSIPTFLTILASYMLTGTDITETLAHMELREGMLFPSRPADFPCDYWIYPFFFSI